MKHIPIEDIPSRPIPPVSKWKKIFEEIPDGQALVIEGQEASDVRKYWVRVARKYVMTTRTVDGKYLTYITKKKVVISKSFFDRIVDLRR